jgi:glycosyltransferase involved in cell wall biosynthesis
MEIRDLWPQTIIDMGKLSEHNPIIRLLQVLEKFLYNQAERIITLLPLAGEYIVARGIAKEKIVWIPNGVDLSKFASMEVKEPDGEFKVIYLGAHGQANDLGLVLDAAGIVQAHGYRDIKFVLIGDGPEKPNLMEKKGKLRLQNLEFHDPVPKSSVPKVLSEANATLQIMMNLPLHKYGLSANKLFDYMAASKPIILVGDIANDPIKSAYCGLTVPPRDPQALADAVIKLYEMPKEEREAMGRRGREYVEKYHAIPVLAHRLMRCLEEMP